MKSGPGRSSKVQWLKNQVMLATIWGGALSILDLIGGQGRRSPRAGLTDVKQSCII
jgi:hypothetical protein